MPDEPSLAHWGQCTSLYAAPVWGRLNGSLLVCLRKDVAYVSQCVPGLGAGVTLLGEKAHFMCVFYASRVSCASRGRFLNCMQPAFGVVSQRLLGCVCEDVALTKKRWNILCLSIYKIL